MAMDTKMRGLLVALAMISGAFGLGFGFGRRVSEQVPASSASDRSVQLERMRELRDRIRALDAELAKQKKSAMMPEVPQDEAVTNAMAYVAKPRLVERLEDGSLVANLAGSCPPEELAARLEALKADDPATFGRVEAAIREHVDGTVAAASNRLTRLSELSAVMTDKDSRETHERLVATVTGIAQAHARMNDFSSRSSSDRELAEAAAELSEALPEQLAAERRVLLGQLAGELGYAGEDAQMVVDTIEMVVQATEADPEGDQASQLNAVVIAPAE